MSVIAVLTTTDSRQLAEEIASALVDRKLAACVQVSKIDSFYTWDGSTQQTPEYRLLIKTSNDRYAEVEAAIRDLHSYDLPAIYAFDMTHIFEPYAAWVAENSDGEVSKSTH